MTDDRYQLIGREIIGADIPEDGCSQIDLHLSDGRTLTLFTEGGPLFVEIGD